MRRKQGISKVFIAKNLGVSRGTIDNWIEGKSFPRLDQAVRLADLLNCKVDDLYERTE